MCKQKINSKLNHSYLIEIRENISLCAEKKWAQARLKMLSKMSLETIYFIYKHKNNLALNTLQWLISNQAESYIFDIYE